MANQQIILSQRPAGIPQPEHFRQIETAEPALPTGGLLIKNHFLSIDPAMRGWICDLNNYLPPVAIDGVMRSLAAGQVIASDCSQYQVGDYVTGWFGWQQIAAISPDQVIRKVAPEEGPLSASLGVLGLNGITAYLALHEIGRPKAGETVLVSTAAGAVGSVVGQLAKLAGCQVIGLTSSEDKIASCTKLYGYDLALNYRTADNLEQLIREHCPQKIDVFFDNTAGAIADSVFANMNVRGRIIQCGTASISQWDPLPTGPRHERFILTQRLLHQGFVVFDYLEQWPQVIAELSTLIHQGQLNYQEDVREGLSAAPQALADLYTGNNSGKTLIRL